MLNQFNQPIGNIVANWSPRKIPTSQEIKGRFCTLEALNIEVHAPQLFAGFKNNDEIYTYLPFGPFSDYQSFLEWITTASQEKIYYTVIDCNSNQPQGIASFHDIDIIHGSIEVGSIIYSKYLQKTIAATETMYLMMQEVFDSLGYRRYQWRCNALNQPSRNAAQRFGFTFEGIFRNHYVFKGRNRDSAWYSIIDTEWPSIKTKFEKWLLPNNFDKHGKQLIRLSEISNT